MSKKELTATETLLTASLAGASAAAVESVLTYPFEFLKTQAQLCRRINGARYDMPEPGRVLYRGLSALITGNSLKAFARYSVYNSATKFMTDRNGQVAAPQVVVAGMITGCVESLIIVPFESIKTTMIERTLRPELIEINANSAIIGAHNAPNARKAAPVASTTATVTAAAATTGEGANKISAKLHPHQKPTTVRPKAVRPTAPPIQLKPGQTMIPVFPVDTSIKSFFGNLRSMYAERGLRAFGQGFAPTIFRQLTYSTVQFTTYNAVKQAIHPNSNDPMPSYKALMAGFMSGVAVVIATQPIDLVKTRMQSINARSVYRSTPRAIYKIFVEEGFTTFWVGTVPRFFKIVGGSAVTFTLYEIIDNLVRKATTQNPFFPE